MPAFVPVCRNITQIGRIYVFLRVISLFLGVNVSICSCLCLDLACFVGKCVLGYSEIAFFFSKKKKQEKHFAPRNYLFE